MFLAQGHAQPEPGFGVLGVERDGFAEIGDGEAGAAAQLRGQVEIADAVSGPGSGGVGRFLDGLAERVLGLGAVAEAGEEVGDGLAVEGAEDAVGIGGGLEGDGFFRRGDALFGGLARGLAVVQLDIHFGQVGAGGSKAELGGGIVGSLGRGRGGFGDVPGERGAVLLVARKLQRRLRENGGTENGQDECGFHAPSIVRAD